jgi:hypothetical protein
MKTQDLRDNDLDSIWTPGPFWTPQGLQTATVPPAFPGTELALTRAVESALEVPFTKQKTRCALYKDDYQEFPVAM